MVEVVEAQADDLAGFGHQRRERRAGQRQARRLSMPARRGRGGQVDAGHQRGAQVGRHVRLRVVQVDQARRRRPRRGAAAVAKVGGEFHGVVS